MENKKKGFWASLFSPKPCKCSCGAYQIPAEEAAVSTRPSDAGAVREVKVLGPGCAKCKSTYNVVEKAIKAAGADIQVTKVEDIEEIMHYNVMATPAIVVDGKVVLKGKVPSEAEVRQILGL